MALSPRRRSALESGIALLLLLLAAILLNVVANQRWAWVDLTADQRHTLAPETRALLERAQGPIEIRAFLPSRVPARYARVIRATAVQLTTPMASVIMVSDAPKSATITMENRSVGST